MAFPLKSMCDFWPGFSSPYDTHSPSFSHRLPYPQFPKASQSASSASLSTRPVPYILFSAIHNSAALQTLSISLFVLSSLSLLHPESAAPHPLIKTGILETNASS